MKKTHLNDKYQQLIVGLLCFSVLLLLFSPNNYFFRWSSRFMVQIMFTYLLLGLSFLALQLPRLTFASFACCAVLCLYLKNQSSAGLAAPPKTEGPILSVAYFTPSGSSEGADAAIDTLLAQKADIFSVQEVTPDWDVLLREKLKTQYPYYKTIPRADIFGIAIFSKYPFEQIDTFLYEQATNIIVRIQFNHEPITFISSYTYPMTNATNYDKLCQHLKKLTAKAITIHTPLVTMGGYNTVLWSPEMQDFLEKAKLRDGRRGFKPTSNALTLFQVPIDHIFHSIHLKCIDFQLVNNKNNEHLGVKGLFQFSSSADVQK